MKNKYFKILLNIFIILIVLLIVLYFSLKDNYKEIINTIFTMDPLYLISAIILLLLYRIITSISYYNIIKINKEKVPFIKCILINFIVLFFHGVTPFAGGGQPVEIYLLHKEKISLTKSTNITLQNFIVYQIALVLINIFALIYNNLYNIFPEDNIIKKLVLLGFIINLSILLISFFLSHAKKTQKTLSNKIIQLLSKLKLIKDEEKTNLKINKYLTNFHENATKLKNNKTTLIKSIILNIISLFILYTIPYTISKGMNIEISLINSIVSTTYVMIIGSFIPIPGGTGGIEYSFIFFFGYLIKGSITNALMLVWRFITYYLGMILGGIALLLYRKEVNKWE